MTQVDLDQVLRETFLTSAEYHASLVSTNDWAIRSAAGGKVSLPRMVLADHQTGGRGRGGNRWWTGAGSLAFSLLLRAESARAPLAGLAAGVAVTEVLAQLAPGRNIGLHWPNDVMAGEKKLSGILVEVLPDGLHVVGIGVNVNCAAVDAPAELQAKLATRRDLTGQPHDRTAVLIALLRRLEQLWALLATAPAEIAARADATCLQRGKTLTLQQGRATISGRCDGIAADGSLRLETAEGPRAIYSSVVTTG